MSDPDCSVVPESKVNNETISAMDDINLRSDKRTETSTMNTTTSEDSEYETLEEDNGRSSRSSGSRRSSFSDDLSDDINIEDEREDGDGQEENSVAKDKKLDDDEDKRNPQYIPKKGTFYEHDDRTMVDENGGEGQEIDPNRRDNSVENEKDAKTMGKKGGKVWTEKVDRWTHDLYNEDEQRPKSTQELIDTYGYDIRNEEAPPKARRRRRYGRGPNKYTRNWEDEEAYTRVVPQRRVFHNNKEEFPDLGSRGRNRDKGQGRNKSPTSTESKSKSPAQRNVQVQNQIQGKQGSSERDHRDLPRGERPRRESGRGERDRGMERGRGSRDPPPSNIPSQPTDRHSLSSTSNLPPPPLLVEKNVGMGEKEGERRVGRGRGFRGTGKPRPTMEFTASRGRAPLPPAFSREPVSNQVDDSLKHAAEMLVQDFSHIYINNNNTNNIVEETIVPRSERRSHGREVDSGGPSEPSGRSKRYSTQRQRSLPETTPPPTYSPPHNIPYYTQPPPPPSSYVPTPVYNEVAGPQVPLMAFLPPGPPPPSTAAPPYPPPPLLNYMPPPAFPPIALQPPQMSGQFEDGCGAEVYQGQGGITYYSPQSQSVVPRPNPPRRVKLAIPIVPPPDNKQQQQQQQRGSSGGSDGAKQQTQTQQEIQSAAT